MKLSEFVEKEHAKEVAPGMGWSIRATQVRLRLLLDALDNMGLQVIEDEGQKPDGGTPDPAAMWEPEAVWPHLMARLWSLAKDPPPKATPLLQELAHEFEAAGIAIAKGLKRLREDTRFGRENELQKQLDAVVAAVYGWGPDERHGYNTDELVRRVVKIVKNFPQASAEANRLKDEHDSIRELCASAGCATPPEDMADRTLCMVEELRQRKVCLEDHDTQQVLEQLRAVERCNQRLLIRVNDVNKLRAELSIALERSRAERDAARELAQSAEPTARPV